jgi:hypothetical protein
MLDSVGISTNTSYVEEIRKNTNLNLPLTKIPFLLTQLKFNAGIELSYYIIKTFTQTMSAKTVQEGERSGRNAAHRGPIFLPWHWEFLRRFEEDLGIV